MLLGRENKLLATLPAALNQKWEKHFSLRELKVGQSLNPSTDHQEVYFPISCVIAVYARNNTGWRTFMRFVGPSFAAGLVNMFATDNVLFDHAVCGTGYAITVPSEVVMKSIEAPTSFGAMQSIAMARTARGSLKIAQCMGSHTTKQRLARLLLQAHDCFGTERPITLTQKSLGEMLMARRETVAEVLAEWRKHSVIRIATRGDSCSQRRCTAASKLRMLLLDTAILSSRTRIMEKRSVERLGAGARRGTVGDSKILRDRIASYYLIASIRNPSIAS